MSRFLDRAWKHIGAERLLEGRRETTSPTSEGDAGPLPADFDSAHYLALNPDLAALGDDPRQAEAHYLASGRSEGRVYRFDGDAGPLPADFDAARYLGLNPDLAALGDGPRRAEVHYLAVGRSEGRTYRFDTDEYGQFPADFNADAYIDANADLEPLRGKVFEAGLHYLTIGRSEGRSYKHASRPGQPSGRTIEARDPPRDWTAVFKPGDFRALRPDLAGTMSSREQAVAAFIERGIDALAPLSFEVAFDPSFYGARYEEAAGLAPAEAYRQWLFAGLEAGRPGSEREAVGNLLGLSDYPQAFDWESYTAALSRPDRVPWTRIRALEHLVECGLGQIADIPLKGPDASFLLAISHVLWERKRRRPALQALERALEMEPADGALHHVVADRYSEIEDWAAAERHERAALRLGQESVWVYRNLIDLASRRGDFNDAYDRLAQSKGRCAGYRPWREALRDTIDRDFAHSAGRVWGLYHDGKRRDADALMEETLTRLTEVIRALDDLPGFVGPAAGGHVVMFANHGLPQCRHYRIEQRCQQLDLLGVAYRLFDSQEAELAREALVGARALIVYREPAFPATLKLLIHARASGVPTFYDIDDLIFDPDHYPDAFHVYEKQIPVEDYVGLLYGTPLIRFAITLCDAGITSTTVLARHVGPLTIGHRCHVVPNGLDSRNERFIDAPPPAPRTVDDEVFIFYGSGSKAHNRNFNETVGPALAELLASRPRVKLVAMGYLDLDPAFEPFADRILRFRFSSDLAAYWALLSEVDVNLGVLVPGEMNDCKSEIKWLEAAVSGVPSVVSASARYREVVRDGVDAVLAQTSAEWREALFRLVDDPGLRGRIGARARERARSDYSLAATAARLGDALEDAPPTAAGPRRRTRVLVTHVLFPPQSSGGATRVVRDNVDDLLDRYGAEFDLAVFTTDFDAPHPSSRVGSYRGIPVYRCSRNTAVEFEYQDDHAAGHFKAVLRSWKPDLVQFHCIQFLTGSVVEACRQAQVPYVVMVHDAWWISPYQFLIDDDLLLRLPAPRALSEPLREPFKAPPPPPSKQPRVLVREAGLDDLTASPRDPEKPSKRPVALELRLEAVDRKRFLADQLAGAAAVTAVSESFAEIYRNAGVPNVRAVPNGLSPAFLERVERPRRSGADRVRIGHIGGMSRHKGVHLLKVALTARGFDNLEAVVIDHAEPPGFERRLTWGTTPVLIRGAVDQDRMAELYEGLDVLVAPSIWPESYGLVSREALAMGLWVVVSDLGAIGEDVVAGENGYVIDVKDARALTEVLQRIDADPDTYRSSPALPFLPRMASEQTDELASLYRDVARRHLDVAGL